MSSFKQSVMFIGAGSTASLGMTTTFNLGQFITSIKNEQWHQALAGISTDEQQKFLSLWRLFSRERLPRDEIEQKLHDLYNAKALLDLLEKVPQRETLQLTDIYNLIDMHIELRHGVKSAGDVISLDDLIRARRLLDVLVIYRHTLDYRSILKDKKEQYIQYQLFAEFLAKEMQREGIALNKEQFNQRNFYLFSYSIISLNWDPIFLWLLFNAHKKVNEDAPFIGNPASPLKLYHDFAHPMHMRKITNQSNDAAMWFPMNEGAAYRLNDPKHATGKRVRLGKFYFPHGSHAFRECQNCGKLNIFLGDEWGYESQTLFPPTMFDVNSLHRVNSSKEEKERTKHIDALACVHCEAMTYSHDTSIVMQTNFKGNHPAYIEEIQRDMKVTIEKAQHIILFGYSLPIDDFVYHSILAAKKGENAKVSIVGGGAKKSTNQEWVYGKEIEKRFSKKDDDVYQTYAGIKELFGEENIRVYTGRIPDVFQENGSFSEEKAKRIFEF